MILTPSTLLEGTLLPLMIVPPPLERSASELLTDSGLRSLVGETSRLLKGPQNNFKGF